MIMLNLKLTEIGIVIIGIDSYGVFQDGFRLNYLSSLINPVQYGVCSLFAL